MALSERSRPRRIGPDSNESPCDPSVVGYSYKVASGQAEKRSPNSFLMDARDPTRRLG
jgi:hypothetical protein